MSWNRGWANNQPTQSQQNRARNAPPSGGSSGRAGGGGTQTGGNQGGAGASNRGGFGWGSNFGPGTTGTQSPVVQPQQRPPMPDSPLPEGWTWQWNGTNWVPVEGEDTRPPRPDIDPAEGHEWFWDGTRWIQRRTAASTSGLRASLRSWINANFPPELAEQAMPWVESVLTEGRPGGQEQIILELQEQEFFKAAYPELAARRLRGLPNVSLDYIRNYRTDAKRIARTIYGTAITDQQIANLIGNDISIDEFGHRLTTFKRMERMGGPVRAFFEEAVGYRLDDQDLYEWFDNEIDTAELDEAYEEARLRGTPVLFGLNPRSRVEADALQMMMANTGVSLDEVVARMEAVGQNASRFQRLGAIESNIVQGLPENFGEFYKDIPNELLWQAEVWQNPTARAMIQDIVAREGARWNQRSGAVSAQGQQVGLLNQGERATFG